MHPAIPHCMHPVDDVVPSILLLRVLHDLPVAVDRRTGVPRSQRICPHCPIGDIGDEHHLIFKRSAVQHIRDCYPGLFRANVQTMIQFMWQDNKNICGQVCRSVLGLSAGCFVQSTTTTTQITSVPAT
jgi:hypothetical protein